MNKLACAVFVAAAATSVQVQHVDGLSSQGNYLSQLQPTVSGELHLESINGAVRTGAYSPPVAPAATVSGELHWDRLMVRSGLEHNSNHKTVVPWMPRRWVGIK